jgi:hypothetical protein
MFDVRAKRGALQRRIGLDIEHAAVRVAHQAEPVAVHTGGDAGGIDPRVDLSPADGIVVEHAGDLVKAYAGAFENIRDLRNRTGGTMGEPVAGHLCPVAEAVEAGVVDRWRRCEVEDDYGHLRALDHGQHGRRQRIRRDVEENHIDVGAAKLAARGKRTVGIVDEAKVHDLDSLTGEFRRNAAEIALETLLEAGELGPVRVEADTEKANAKRGRAVHRRREIIASPRGKESGL